VGEIDNQEQKILLLGAGTRHHIRGAPTWLCSLAGTEITVLRTDRCSQSVRELCNAGRQGSAWSLGPVAPGCLESAAILQGHANQIARRRWWQNWITARRRYRAGLDGAWVVASFAAILGVLV